MAVEPQPDNYKQMLTLLGEDRLFIPLRAAIASFDGAVDLVDHGLGEFGFRTEQAREGTPAYR